MKSFLLLLVGLFSFSAAYCEDVDRKQAELDAKCENARQTKLEPLKKEVFADCMAKEEKEEAECQAEADGFNGARADRAPMFYDLPECSEAFEYRKKHSDREA